MENKIEGIKKISFITVNNKLLRTDKKNQKPNVCSQGRRPKAIMSDNKQTYDLTDDGKGKKYDTGKPMIGTIIRVFPNAMEALGSVIEFGTHKYPDPNNWKKVEGAKFRYLDSLMRHMVKHYRGLELDEETGKPHLAHMAWNALAILELYLMEQKEKESKK